MQFRSETTMKEKLKKKKKKTILIWIKNNFWSEQRWNLKIKKIILKSTKNRLLFEQKKDFFKKNN